MLFLSITAVAIGDAIDDGLTADAPMAVKASTRQAIQSGLADQAVIALTQAMLRHQFDEKQVQRVHTLLVVAKTSGVPVDTLMNKAHEGMTKNVPPYMIIKAMETVQARNLFAYQHAAKFAEEPGQKRELEQLLAASLAAGLS